MDSFINPYSWIIQILHIFNENHQVKDQDIAMDSSKTYILSILFFFFIKKQNIATGVL